MKHALSVTRQNDFAEWYQQVVKVAGLAEHGAVRGCMNILPWGYSIWENIQQKFDKRLKETGHRNAYFPLLIPLSFLAREAEHVDGFAKECAVVTHHRLTSVDGRLMPDSDAQLEEPLVIRPTSETIIGDAFSRWVQSPKDLPLLINQWCNVMRWEMRPRLFLRTSEFLWQEGHTAHATRNEANDEARLILSLYTDFVTNVLCMPVYQGEKPPGERFPGAVNTWSIEAMMQDGKALQSGTSHFLGQNFSKAYKIKFSSEGGDLFAWTTSWGISTRLIGGVIMTHSDDNGLVLPPAIAPLHLRVLVLADDPTETESLHSYISSFLCSGPGLVSVLGEPLRHEIVNVGRRPGTAFWDCVKQGVPLIVQIGSKEKESGTVTYTIRTDSELKRQTIPAGQFVDSISSLLNGMQRSLLERATQFRDANTLSLSSVHDLREQFDRRPISPFAICPIDISMESSTEFQAELANRKLSVRCLLDSASSGHHLEDGSKCLFSGGQATHLALIAKSY